jgi:hypothetical protein
MDELTQSHLSKGELSEHDRAMVDAPEIVYKKEDDEELSIGGPNEKTASEYNSKRIDQLHKTIQRDDFSPEINEIWDRVESGDPNIVTVDMNESKSIKTASTDLQEKIIWTYDLVGCFAEIIYATDGATQSVKLRHDNPLHFSQRDLDEDISSDPMLRNDQRISVIILAKAETEPANDAHPVFKAEKVLQNITEVLRGRLPGVDIKIQPYYLRDQADSKDKGCVIIRMQPSGKTTYRTWFNQEQLGEVDVV